MELKNGTITFHAKTTVDWRNWLEIHHQSEQAVWLIIYRKHGEIPSVQYDEAVEEALCFGWIDSKPNKRDDQSYYLYFSQRKPKSNWSKVNKERISRMLAAGKMAPAGLRMVEEAKITGTWTALDEVEKGIVPDDLRELFDENQQAWEYWQAFPPSTKRAILEWILNAKRPETRQKRINETVALAAQNIRANQYRQPKKK